MKKLKNESIASNVIVKMEQMCGPSTNCGKSGCSCSKCSDSQSKTSDAIREIYNKK